MHRNPTTFMSGDLRLEGALYTPDGAAPKGVVVVCHPHPLYGGNMENNVVQAIVRALTGAGIAALAFNFRGVGASQGSHDNGVGETDDVRSAIAHAATLVPGVPVGLAGYSFGAGRAAAAVRTPVAALALVAPATERLDRHCLAVYAGPALLVAGDADHVCCLELVREIGANAGGETEVVAVPGTDHFWRGRESQLETLIGGFFARVFPTTAG